MPAESTFMRFLFVELSMTVALTGWMVAPALAFPVPLMLFDRRHHLHALASVLLYVTVMGVNTWLTIACAGDRGAARCSPADPGLAGHLPTRRT